jgi:hypothetical protein
VAFFPNLERRIESIEENALREESPELLERHTDMIESNNNMVRRK